MPPPMHSCLSPEYLLLPVKPLFPLECLWLRYAHAASPRVNNYAKQRSVDKGAQLVLCNITKERINTESYNYRLYSV